MHIVSGRYNPREGEHDGLVVHQLQEVDPLYRVPLARRYRMIPALQKSREGGQAGPRPLALPPAVRLLDGARRARPARRQPVGEGRDRRRMELAEGRGARAHRHRARPRARVRRQLAGARGRVRAARRRRARSSTASSGTRASTTTRRRRPTAQRWRDLGWPDDAVVCLSLRNFRPYSNLDIVLKAFAAAHAEMPRAAALLHRRRRLDARRVRQRSRRSSDRAVHGGARRARLGAAARERLRRLRGLARRCRLLPRVAARDDGERRSGHRRPRAVDGRVDPERPRRRARRAARRRGRDGGDAQARPRPASSARRTASGTSPKSTRGSAIRPRSSSRSTARCLGR